MSTSTQPARPSLENLKAIFNAASSEYKRVTGKCLYTHPVAAQLGTCDDPDAVSNMIRTQAQDFGKFCTVGENLMNWLDQTIHILSIFSETLEKGMELVSPSLVHSLLLFSNAGFSVVLTRDDNLYRNRYPFHG